MISNGFQIAHLPPRATEIRERDENANSFRDSMSAVPALTLFDRTTKRKFPLLTSFNGVDRIKAGTTMN